MIEPRGPYYAFWPFKVVLGGIRNIKENGVRVGALVTHERMKRREMLLTGSLPIVEITVGGRGGSMEGGWLERGGE